MYFVCNDLVLCTYAIMVLGFVDYNCIRTGTCFY